MAQSMISIRMDEKLKKEWADVCEELGLNISSVVTILAKKMTREQRLPFDVSIVSEEPKGKTEEKEVKPEPVHHFKPMFELDDEE